MRKNILIALLAVSLMSIVSLHAQIRYKLPPKEIIEVIDAPRPPAHFLSPCRNFLLLAEYDDMPPIEYLTKPVFRMAHMRISPHNNSQLKTKFYTKLTVITLHDGSTQSIELPENSKLGIPTWSFDGRWIAFPRYKESGVELWAAETKSGKARALTEPAVNATLSLGYRQVEHELNASWMPDNRHILVNMILKNRGAPPDPPDVPVGPLVQETSGKHSKQRTWSDLLKNIYDETLFDFYTTSQIYEVDVISCQMRKIGLPGKFHFPPAPSPDGKYILIQRIKRPYSYFVRYRDFARSIEIWDRDGEKVSILADLPPADEIPIRGTSTGPRAIQWQAHKPATLIWVEAVDRGDPEKQVQFRDKLMSWSAPFRGKPVEIMKIRYRYTNLSWLQKEGQALLTEYDWKQRWRITHLVDFKEAGTISKKIFDYGNLDRYNHPGNPVNITTKRGEELITQHGEWIYLSGSGATHEGDRPFLDRVNLKSTERQRLFHSGKSSHEVFIAFVGESLNQAVISHETQIEPRNFFRVNLKTKEKQALTNFKHPFPEFKDITKQLVKYKRSDGIGLSGMLYLPAGYNRNERLPLVIWAYPREYRDPGIAGQVRTAPNKFISLRGSSPPFSWIFVTQGYAVLDGAEMPVVGDPKTMNETFIEQIKKNARAAIEKLDSMGLIDPKRVGIVGHSYGAFMVANLLAHSDLFAAGIARSGAYNRILTPFGFQRERRTLWEVPEFYIKVSPYMNAHKINEPILLLHGEIDDSPATLPMQSKRLFHALRGLGGTARLVLLPNENHRYTARASILHVATEMIDWFDRFVKNRADLNTTKR